MRMCSSIENNTDSFYWMLARNCTWRHRFVLSSCLLAILMLLQLPYSNHCLAGGFAATTEQLLQLLVKHAMPEGAQGKAIFASAQPLAGGTAIGSWGFTYTAPDSFRQSWYFFVDDQPEANWEHPCRYIFIDIDTNESHILTAKTPPDKLTSLRSLYPQ